MKKKTIILLAVSLVLLLIVGTIFFINQIPIVKAQGGTCEGSTPNCDGFEESEICEFCGCIWEFGSCAGGSGEDCDIHSNQGDCEDCGCEWIVEPGPQNFYVNVGDTWPIAQEVWVNVGDTWYDVELVRVNVGDTWRTIFSI